MSYLMRIDPMRELMRMERIMQSLLRPFGAEAEGAEAGMRVPSVDISETENEVIVKAELPGIRKEDLNLQVLPDRVILSAETSKEEEKQEGTYHMRERMWGRFQRTIPLPTEVKSDQAKAHMENGVLEVRLPKQEPSRAPEAKRVSVD